MEKHFIMNKRPIGIFDSGLGGLTAVMALRKLMPEENIVYFADSARVPYGSKSRAELLVMARASSYVLATPPILSIFYFCRFPAFFTLSQVDRNHYIFIISSFLLA